MMQAGHEPPPRSGGRDARVLGGLGGAAVLIFLALGAADGARAQEQDGWTILVEPMFMDGFGHDQQVLTTQSLDFDSVPAVNARTPASLNTESGLAARFELKWDRGGLWDLGIDGFLFSASRGRPARSGAAEGPAGAIDQVVFDTWDRSYVSNDPGEELFFGVLGDTDVAIWTVDVYGIKPLVESTERSLSLVLGVRNADFDNDFHGQAGIGGAGGSFFDSFSNYDRMIGPLVGISSDMHFGRHTVRGYLGQSVIFGSAQFGHTTSDFIGDVSDTPSIVAVDSVSRDDDVAIPITELRVNWLRPISERLALGVAANASIWWDVQVPPNVVPATEGGGFNENTIVFFGVGLAVWFDF